jgi:hypothetical protein
MTVETHNHNSSLRLGLYRICTSHDSRHFDDCAFNSWIILSDCSAIVITFTIAIKAAPQHRLSQPSIWLKKIMLPSAPP